MCGLSWLRQFQPEPAQLSNGLATDRQWCAFHFTACLIKGFCNPDVITNALAAEGVRPVLAYSGADGPFALATLWLNVIHDSVCGTYHEVVLSIDATTTSGDAVAFRVPAKRAPWAVLYPNFGPSVCDSQFLHSLWIDSPLSITWGREMQGFPKHPKPVSTTITDDKQFSFDLRWDDRLVMRGAIHKRFGVRGLVRESLGLLTTHRLRGVLGFLSAKAFSVPILMPAKTATQNRVSRHYIGHLWKGLNPAAVQVWPWGPNDSLELGESTLATGCEDHNGHRLLRDANFRPVTVTYLPHIAAFVEEQPQ